MVFDAKCHYQKISVDDTQPPGYAADLSIEFNPRAEGWIAQVLSYLWLPYVMFTISISKSCQSKIIYGFSFVVKPFVAGDTTTKGEPKKGAMKTKKKRKIYRTFSSFEFDVRKPKIRRDWGTKLWEDMLACWMGVRK